MAATTSAREVTGRKVPQHMHIAEGFLPAAHAAAWTAVAAPFVIHGAREVVRTVRRTPEAGVLLGAAGAFTFVMSAVKLPSVTGSSSHPTGTGLGTIIFRPPVMAFVATVVLLFQALLLAHGGLTTLGANIFSMGVAGPWIAYAAFVACRRVAVPLLGAVFVAAFLADLATYLVTSAQLAFAFPSAEHGMWHSMGEFLAVFALTQIPLAIVEALIVVVIVSVLLRIAARELDLLGFFRRARLEGGAAPAPAADDAETTDAEKKEAVR